MATTQPVFTDSTDTFSVSPPLITDHLSSLDSLSGAARISRTSARKTRLMTKVASPSPQPSGGSQEPEWAMQPFNAPRSMRREITPPPLRRDDSNRSFDRQERRLRTDLYRPAQCRYGDDVGNERAASPSSRGSSAHRRYSAEDDDGERIDASMLGMHRYHGHQTRPLPQSGSTPRGDRRKEQTRAQVRSGAAMAALGRASDAAWSGQSAFDSRQADIAFRERRNDMAYKIRHSDTSLRGRHGVEDRRSGSSDQTINGIMAENGEDDSDEADEVLEVLNRHCGLTVASLPGGNLNRTPSNILSSLQVNVSPVPATYLPTPETTVFTPDDDDAGLEEGYTDTIEKANMTDVFQGLVGRKVPREMLGGHTHRIANEETASTSSRATSRSRAVCKACGTPGSQVTPLVPCSRCRKGFHERCGNPKPQHSARPQDFVCGRCLRKHPLELIGRSELRTGNSSRNSPASVLPSLRLLPTLNPPKPTQLPVSDVPRRGGTPAGHEEADGYKKIDEPARRTVSHQPPLIPAADRGKRYAGSAMQGSLYKHITCPEWKHQGCYLVEAHCLYTHRDTGRDAPYRNAQAKAFTCPYWERKEECPSQWSECAFSHEDTGLYIGPDNKPLRKHLTCYFWNHGNQCNTSEEECPFAHEKTGILAWRPRELPNTHPGVDSLRSYLCPRWEAARDCRWLNEGCPYSHSRSARSCLDLNNTARARSGDDGRLNAVDAVSPSTPTPELSPAPSVANNARSTHLSFVEPVTSSENNIGAAETLGATDSVRASDVTSLRSDLRLASPPVAGIQIPSGEGRAVSCLKDKSSTDADGKLVKHMAKTYAMRLEPRKGRVQYPETNSYPTLDSVGSKDAMSGYDPPSTTHMSSAPIPLQTADPLHRQQANPFQRRSSDHHSFDLESGKILSVDGARRFMSKLKVLCDSDQLLNRCLEVLNDSQSSWVDVARAVQKIREVLGGHSLLAQQFDTLFPPEYRIDCSTGTGRLAHAVNPGAYKEPPSSSQLKPSTGAASNPPNPHNPVGHLAALPAGRKPCEGCREAIFGQDSRCVKCSVSVEQQDKYSQAADKLISQMGVTSPITLATGESGPALDLSIMEDSPPRGRGFSPSLEQCDMPNTLKRNHRDDMLFVPRKRIKPSPLSIQQTQESLRRSSRGLSAGSTEGFSSTGNRLERRQLHGNIEPCSADREAPSTSDDPDTHGTSFSSSLASSKLDLPEDDGNEGEVPKTLHSKAPTSDSIEASTKGNRWTLSRRGTTCDTMAIYERLSQGSTATSDISMNTSTEQVADHCSTALGGGMPPSSCQADSIPADPASRSPYASQVQDVHGSSDALNRDRDLQESMHRFDTAAQARGWSAIAESVAQREQSDSAISCESSSQSGSDVFLRSSVGSWARCSQNADDAPAIEDENPAMEPNAPAIEDDTPAMGDDNTAVEDDNLAVEDDNTAVEDDNPAMEDDASEREDDSLEEEDGLHNLPLMRLRPPPRTVPRQSSTTMSDIENGDDVPLNKLRGLERVREIDSADICALFKAAGKDEGFPSIERPSTKGRAESSLSERQHSSTAAEVVPPGRAKEDVQVAVARLKAQGVMFETDSESDDDSVDLAYPPRQGQNEQSSSNLFHVIGYWDAHLTSQPLPAHIPTKPSRKQLVGNLLKYQCREQKRKFGNPHQELNRPLPEMEVEAIVQRETRMDTPDPFAVGRLEKATASMTIREFIGGPEKPVITFGKNNEELVFIEGKTDPGGRTQGTPRARARRIKHDDKFPFVYK